jgi:hypothetical protein
VRRDPGRGLLRRVLEGHRVHEHARHPRLKRVGSERRFGPGGRLGALDPGRIGRRDVRWRLRRGRSCRPGPATRRRASARGRPGSSRRAGRGRTPPARDPHRRSGRGRAAVPGGAILTGAPGAPAARPPSRCS